MPGGVRPQASHIEHSALHMLGVLAQQLFDLHEVLWIIVMLVSSLHLQVAHAGVNHGNRCNAFREQVAVSVAHRLLVDSVVPASTRTADCHTDYVDVQL
jgi:hypothetical protein